MHDAEATAHAPSKTSAACSPGASTRSPSNTLRQLMNIALIGALIAHRGSLPVGHRQPPHQADSPSQPPARRGADTYALGSATPLGKCRGTDMAGKRSEDWLDNEVRRGALREVLATMIGHPHSPSSRARSARHGTGGAQPCGRIQAERGVGHVMGFDRPRRRLSRRTREGPPKLGKTHF